jgi:hypothetical protein
MASGAPSFDIHGLPRIVAIHDLAVLTGVSARCLWWLASETPSSYETFSLPKKSGGTRLIRRPTGQLLHVQRWILRNILDRLHTAPSSFGFERRRGLRHHAEQHSGARAVLTLDIKDFFPTISIAQVTHVYRVAGYPSSAGSVLARLCTHNGVLPQGAPTSPRLANLVCRRLDSRLSHFARRRGMVYTRYADDMSFSSSSASELAKARPFVAHIVRDCGFRLNEAKSRLVGPRGRKTVTGLVVADNGVGVGRHQLRELRARIHHAHRLPNGLHTTSLQGWLDYVSDVDPLRYQTLVRYIEQLRGAGASGLAALRVRPAASPPTNASERAPAIAPI